jgi:hypothetical protein
MHPVWLRIRGPFRCLHCPTHSWERYDVSAAGCLRCGCEHRCANSVADSTCPLVTLDDGGVCCPITGYCPPVVRYAKSEYSEQFVPQEAPSCPDTNLHQEVHGITEWFLLGGVTRACKQEEMNRSLNRFACVVIKTLKQQKLEPTQRTRAQLPCIPSVLAQSLHTVRLQRIMSPSKELCSFCAQHITKCMLALKITPPPHRRVHMVVGLLYLMKQGLVIQDTQWLPRTPTLTHCLPHETCLDKTFNLSMKLVCETENEVKLVLRQRVQRL